MHSPNTILDVGAVLGKQKMENHQVHTISLRSNSHCHCQRQNSRIDGQLSDPGGIALCHYVLVPYIAVQS